MTKEEFINKWNVGYENIEQQNEFAGEMLSDLNKLESQQQAKKEGEPVFGATGLIGYLKEPTPSPSKTDWENYKDEETSEAYWEGLRERFLKSWKEGLFYDVFRDVNEPSIIFNWFKKNAPNHFVDPQVEVSDDEIDKQVMSLYKDDDFDSHACSEAVGWEKGAKWMRDKLKR